MIQSDRFDALTELTYPTLMTAAEIILGPDFSGEEISGQATYQLQQESEFRNSCAIGTVALLGERESQLWL